MGPLDIFDATMAVFGAPARYVQGPGVLDRVGDFARQLGSKAVLVVDEQVRSLIEGRVQRSASAAGLDLAVLTFNGMIGPATATTLAASLPAGTPDVLIAAGGGRAIDAGKALADHLQRPLITVPTVASNDAATSKNYVLYDEAGHLLEVRHLARSPDFVVVDTAVLAQAPQRMFAAGLGDALSKSAEARACAAGRGTTMFLSRPPRLAAIIADAVRDTLVMHGEAAFATAGTGKVTEAFEAAVEAMILMSGLGFESGGLSVPHALTRGLPLLSRGGEPPHGFQVAYGLVVHHRLLGEDLPSDLSQLYRTAGLPLSLRDLLGAPVADEDLARCVAVTMPVRHMLNFPRPLQAQDLLDAMRAVEAAAHNQGRMG